MVFTESFGHGKHITDTDAGGNLRHNSVDHRDQGLWICLFCFFHSKRQYQALSGSTVIIRIHQPQPCISHCLDAIQMIGTRMFQLMGA